MLSPKTLNCSPEEVLYHLRILGYENVSEQQLKEFMRDLKKLIKYDLKRSRLKSEDNFALEVDKECSRSNLSSSSLTTSSTYNNSVENTLGQNESLDSVEITSSSDSSGLSSDFMDHPDFSKLKKKSVLKPVEDNSRIFSPRLAGERKPKSFIRSWRLNNPSGTVKNDPVALYHWYQEHWNKQKVPGEEPHKQLRWSVREKMLGDDPHPRPISQASGRSSRSTRK